MFFFIFESFSSDLNFTPWNASNRIKIIEIWQILKKLQEFEKSVQDCDNCDYIILALEIKYSLFYPIVLDSLFFYHSFVGLLPSCTSVTDLLLAFLLFSYGYIFYR